MGMSILEMVLRRLREEKFSAEMAFPGQKYPSITEPVAAVHIEKVDRSNLSVTVAVTILCPAELGGTLCELEALRATEVLYRKGAACIQSGCEYDGLAQIYSVRILATFTCITEKDECVMGPGFQVFILGQRIPFAVSFEAEQVTDAEAQYVMGEDNPIGIRNGSRLWKLRLEELIPESNPEVYTPDTDFEVRIESDTVTETYRQCRWTSQRREFTRQGLRRIRTAISMERQEAKHG